MGDPRDDQRKVLAVLASAKYPMRRRPIEEAAFGRSSYMVWRTVQALTALETLGLVRRAYKPETAQFDRCWEATERGKEHAEEVSVFHGSAS